MSHRFRATSAFRVPAIGSYRRLASGCQLRRGGCGGKESRGRGRFEAGYLDISGYGVGIRQSEFYPIIGKNRTEKIEAGMVVDLLLPTIYRPDVGGPRITDCIYVGEKQNELLTNYSRELVR